jgi:hypothetical protein
MSENEKNKLLMYETVITYLQENKDIISTYPSFPDALSKLKKAINEIKIKDIELTSNVLGKTIFVNSAKEDLIFTIIPITISIYNFAKEKNNIELKEKTRLTQSYYTRLRNIELVEQSLAIEHFTKKYLHGLIKYGITKNSVLELNTKILKFKNALNTFNNNLITLSSNSKTISLIDQFAEADNVMVNQIDKLVEPLNLENEEFYKDYLAIRSMKYFEEEGEEEYSLEVEIEE